MVGVVQAVGVGKMRAGAAVHGGGLVHDLGKGRHAAVERFGDEVGALVGGAHHGAVEQVLEIDALPHVQAHVGAVVADVGSGLRQVDGLVHIAHHDAQKHGHDLGGRSGIHGGVRILFKNHLAGGCFDEDGRLGVELVLVKILRMLRIVGLHIAGELRFDIVDDVFLFGDSMERERRRAQRNQHRKQQAYKRTHPLAVHRRVPPSVRVRHAGHTTTVYYTTKAGKCTSQGSLFTPVSPPR